MQQSPVLPAGQRAAFPSCVLTHRSPADVRQACSATTPGGKCPRASPWNVSSWPFLDTRTGPSPHPAHGSSRASVPRMPGGWKPGASIHSIDTPQLPNAVLCSGPALSLANKSTSKLRHGWSKESWSQSRRHGCRHGWLPVRVSASSLREEGLSGPPHPSSQLGKSPCPLPVGGALQGNRDVGAEHRC